MSQRTMLMPTGIHYNETGEIEMSESEWNTIDSAPKDGTTILLMCFGEPQFGEHALFWRNGRWEGIAFAVLGVVTTIWDQDKPQPTHWRPLESSEVLKTQTTT